MFLNELGYVPEESSAALMSLTAAEDYPAYESAMIKYSYGGNEYGIYTGTGSITWEKANEICESLGGYLATITTQAEQDRFEEMLTGMSGGSYWLGGTEDDSDVWHWITGEPFEYTNWGSNQPDSSYGNAEKYLGVLTSTYAWGTYGEWNDFRSDDTRVTGFVCEWNDPTKTEYRLLIGSKMKQAVLDDELSPHSPADTDIDGLTDWAEVDEDSYLISYDDAGEPVFSVWVDITATSGYFLRPNMFEAYLNGLYDFMSTFIVVPFDSDPTEGDSDGDGILDSVDTEPLVFLSPRGREIKTFFDNAEFFEIQYMLDYLIIQDDQTVDIDSIESAIKFIRIFREYKGTNNYRELTQRLLDEGIYGRDSIVAIFETVFPQMSTPARYLAEYENYSSGTSFEMLSRITYESWTTNAKQAACIWLLGIRTEYCYSMAEWGYSPWYEISLQQEHTIKRYTGFLNEYIHSNNTNEYGINPADLKMSSTVTNHYNDLFKADKQIKIGNGYKTTHFAGESTRPYTKYGSNLLMDEIMNAKAPVSDPGGIVGGLRWDVQGTLNGTEGIWELVVDVEHKIVVHFLFNSKG